MLDCDDKSDELECEILILEESYRKTAPPVGKCRYKVISAKTLGLSVALMECQSFAIKFEMQVGLTWEKKVRRVLPASVTVSITLLDVAGIREADNEIDIKFTAQFDLFESRATFHNLKKRSSRNTLILVDVKRLWIPNIVYRNNKDNDDTVSALEKSKVKIVRLGNFRRSDLSTLDEIEIFEGKDNPISMIQSYTKPFKCNYDLRYFPFDTQVETG